MTLPYATGPVRLNHQAGSGEPASAGSRKIVETSPACATGPNARRASPVCSAKLGMPTYVTAIDAAPRALGARDPSVTLSLRKPATPPASSAGARTAYLAWYIRNSAHLAHIGAEPLAPFGSGIAGYVLWQGSEYAALTLSKALDVLGKAKFDQLRMDGHKALAGIILDRVG